MTNPIISFVRAFSDNYIWLCQGIRSNLKNPAEKKVLIVDPGDAQATIRVLEQQQLQAHAILITHHHYDHSHGIAELVAKYSCDVYASHQSKLSNISHYCHHGDIIEFPSLGLSFKVMEVPGHTLDHIAFYGHGLLFIGDTLFSSGCGRLFEGTALQMQQSMEKIKELSDSTQIYCAHEYTQQNLSFAKIVEPLNSDIQQRIVQADRLLEQSIPSIPTTLAMEKKFNPFLRYDQVDVIQAAEQYHKKTFKSSDEVFAAVRQWKDDLD